MPTIADCLKYANLQMAAVCLVVGSRTVPVQEVIREGENGVLVDFFPPNEIAQRVTEGLAEPAALDTLRRNARQTVVEDYDLHMLALVRVIEGLRGK